MRRIVVVTIASCLLALLGALTGAAEAADYYGSHHRYRQAWRGDDCCARRVVGYAPRVRYLRLVEQLPYCAYCDRPPVLYQADPYWSPVYASAEVCVPRRVRIADGRGGWVWGVRPVCY